ncbi:NAD-dependent epimerase/dehydratase family protein [Micrococcus terreus]|uniref:NAD-dependent epimerase/dehydratase family protein n=1 Tax=Micrococcus terreus TaxID=574650 RepID=UPI00254FB636|nr:NAD-dependent epimerase/dehydratase family protein [Micrococcus terreus]MDK7701545.1 NAD(P)H-binding protein [Micrococcus terreus]WOO98571.1 NAD(P)H-binding protein [Micrococcus terreus]
MDLLILGGTGQLGRHIVSAALDSRHSVTCLARGTNPAPGGAQLVRADRDLSHPYREVEGTRWDAVVELASAPGRVREATSSITADHWLYVSSISVYALHDQPCRTEDAELVPPLNADRLSGPQDYGPAKVACEQIVQQSASAWTVVRPGLIGGAGDDTGRTGYYPWRFAHPTGPSVVVPDAAGAVVAMIDVKDLAAWLVRCLEQRLTGTFHATGPTTSLTDAIGAARRVAGRATGHGSGPGGAAVVPALPVSEQVLSEQGVNPWVGPDSLPWWVPDPQWRWHAVADTSRARAAGLTFRPLEDTLADALAFEESRGGPVGAGLSEETEHRVRQACQPSP